MEPKGITSRQYFKRLTTVYYVLVVGLSVFVILTGIFLKLEGQLYEFESIKAFFIMTPLITVIGFFCSKIVFKRSLEKLSYKEDLIKKMRGYRWALRAKYAFLAVPSFLTIVVTIITGEKTFLSLAVLLILLLFIEKPSSIKAAKELDLYSENAQTVRNPDKIIA
ncbi:MAG: hypothetical protein LBL13_03820 [Bacteroidales bacterium]|jgi:hypothetical protein|nr:hypothetical protein [Bacteroidales bacterium]